MTAHGPDADTFERALRADTTRPQRISDTMAFMFETRSVIRPTPQALELPQLQPDYAQCWRGITKRFTPPPSPPK
jgi:homogentisate 1,2-dioxygenase